MFFAAGPIESAITNRDMKWEPTEERPTMAGYGGNDHAVAALGSALSGKDYICGEGFTAAHIYAGDQADRGLQFSNFPANPAFETYAGRLREREACKAAEAIDAALIATANEIAPPT